MASPFLILALSLVVPLSASLAEPGEAAQRPVTNADLVAMLKAGLAEDAIITSIQGKPTSFDTSPDALIALKGQGASDNLVRAVLAASQGKAAEPTPAVEINPAAQPSGQGQDRTAVAVMNFDYGTVKNWWGQYDIGGGMADEVVNGLVNDGTFRVIERKKLDTVLAEQDFSQSDRAAPSAAKLSKLGQVLGVRYIIAGSITKFGTEEKNFGTGGIPLPVVGSFGGLFHFKKVKTYVTLTARLIDTTTGQIVASVKGEGLSRKGGGLALAAGGTGFLGAGGMNTSTFKESAVGEAQEGACKTLIQQLVAKKDELKQDH